MSDNQLIAAKIDESTGIAWLTLNRPEKKNALSIALLKELGDLLRSTAGNERIRCVVTQGAGDSYSSGRDLYDMRHQSNRLRAHELSGVAEIVDLMRRMPQVTLASVRGWCLGGGLALINGHDLVVTADTAKFGMPEVIRGSYGATATPSLFHAGIPIKKAFYISLTGRNLTGVEAERIGLVSQVVPERELDAYVEDLAKEIGSRNSATLENAKIAAYLQKDLAFDMALRADDLVQHRLRYYTNPLSDVEGYLHSQKGGGTTGYVKPEDRKTAGEKTER
ncbi:MAG TPA: enoyl-CoA hydratase/isomerase family protein [Candidatus Binatia bacterium]|nr:enoyl-CoA hydratase/isomerase family protein [Candidatus Binatia bacterium]